MKHFGVQTFIAIIGSARSGNAQPTTPTTPTPPIQQNIMEYLRTVPDADYMVTAIEIGWLDDDFSDVGDFEGPWSKY